MGESEIAGDKKQLVVFDFDGTILEGHSPVMLVKYLWSRRIIPASTLGAVGWWAFRYALRLPHEQEEVRERIFRLFQDQTVDETDEMMEKLYTTEISRHLRRNALEAVRTYQTLGVETLLVSASFEAIVARAALELGMTAYLSTRMEKVDNHYTGRIGSVPMEGEEKRRAIVEFANGRYGEGRWEIVAAYGDHHTDTSMLELAKRPVAVTPDNKLRRIAQSRGWEIVYWV